MESTDCPLCGKNSFSVAHQENMSALCQDKQRLYPVIVVVCNNCGHIYNNPRMEALELEAYYSNYYGQGSDNITLSDVRSELYKLDADAITKHVGPGNSRCLFEVGVSTGDFLAMMRSLGWEVSGIEPNKFAADIARSRFGLNVTIQFFENYNETNKNDLLVLGASLEHMADPKNILAKSNSLLKEGGHLFIRVPDGSKLNLNSTSDIFCFEHLHMFTQETIDTFCKLSGFKINRMFYHEGYERHIIAIAEKVAQPESYFLSDTCLKLADINLERISQYSSHLNTMRETINKKLKRFWQPVSVRLMIYGAGNHTEYLLKYTEIRKANIIGLVDSDPRKWGKNIFGFNVFSPKEICKKSPAAIIISSRAYQNDICEFLSSFLPEEIEQVRLYDENKKIRF